MTKTTKPTETIETPAFDISEATDQFRTFAEKGVEQSKQAYATIKTSAENAQKAIENTMETAKTAGSDLSLKAIDALRQNTEAGLAHLEALVGVKSFAEMIELQTAFIRKQAEMLADQAKEMQAVSQKAAENVAKPVKDAFDKALKSA